MSPAHSFIAVALFGTALCVQAAIPFTSKTLTWDEDVMLANGKLLSVHRTATFGPDEWFRPGKGRLTEQTISFESNGQRIKWKNSERYFFYLPQIFDFANGMPIIVMPVHSWPACFKYDFPLEGFVAFGYKGGRWNRIAAADLPNDLKVNLLPETYAVQNWYKGKRVTVAEKEETNQRNGTKQGQPLSDASRVYAGYKQACIRMRPPPDKDLDDARQRNASAERDAPQAGRAVTKSPC